MSAAYKILTSGTKVPSLAFGTGTALYGQDATKQVLQALNAGFRHVDAAQMYANERSVGDAISTFLSSNAREDIYVTTKFDHLSPNAGQPTVKDVLKGQLKALKVDYVDLYLLHTPTPFVGRLGEVWKEFEGVKAEGLAKDIGISNFRVGDLNELFESIDSRRGVVPAVHQIEFHPYVLKATLPILDIHARYGIHLASYGGQTPVSRKRDGPVTAVLQEIAKRISEEGKTPVSEGQVLLKWLDAKDAIAVTTSSKLDRLQGFLAASEIPPLNEEDVRAIDIAGMKIHHRNFMKHMDHPR